MEDNKTAIANRQGKKKIYPLISSLSIGGEGGIAGLFVFGGALAIAGFMAVASFTSSNKHKPKPKPKSQQLLLEEHGCKTEEGDHDTTQSLTSLIQQQQHGDATCCWSINQEEKSSELKQRSVEECPTRFHHQEIVFSDNSHPESATSSNAEECITSLFNSPDGEKDEEDQLPQDDITSSETETETEEEDDDDDMVLSDDVSEIGEENSSSKAGYNKEPVWPSELIQRKLKGDGNVCCDSDDVDGSDLDEGMTVGNQATMHQNLNLLMVPNNSQPLTWVFPFLLLALLLLLVLLTRRPQDSFYVLDEGNLVVKRI